MMIVNADDWGRSRAETDAALACYEQQRITSASAMVFMQDSERAAKVARDSGVSVGLHLNLSQPYNGPGASQPATAAHQRVVSFMTRSKYAVLFYHPGLRRDFAEVFRSQHEEFCRTYDKEPSHVDGHQHRHLCANVLWDDIIPSGLRVRRNFSFFAGDKGWINRMYRRMVDRRLARRYRLTDYFFSLPQCVKKQSLPQVANLARNRKVELMTHPVKQDEYTYLLSDEFGDLLRDVEVVSYAAL